MGTILPFPSTVPVGSSANLTVQMNSNFVGPEFGQLSFSTSSSTASTYSFNIAGTVSGSLSSAAQTVRTPRLRRTAIDSQ